MYTIDTAKTYEGTKRLKAWPATRGEYNTYRGWTIPADENPDEPGYLVEYEPDGRAHVHPSHEGYISWSPAHVFENAYHEISADTWQGRVRQEADALAAKLSALDEFLAQPGLAVGTYQMELLAVQRGYMNGYLATLQQRLQA